MIVIGATGGFDRVDETAFAHSGIHDSAATLVRDGEIVAAIEEERLNRHKHSGKVPLGAIAHCLATAGVGLSDVDKFVFNVLEKDLDDSLEKAYQARTVGGWWRARAYIQQILQKEFRCRVDPARFEFVDHHYAHAASAYLPSGFPESLVVTLDGVGASLSGSVWRGVSGRLIHIRNYDGAAEATTQSVGHFYQAVTAFLGFKNFDEYKVMGLAPYGDRARLRPLFQELYVLKECGDYEIHLGRLDRLKELCPQRRRDEPLEAHHMDIAAALQEALEALVFHILEFHQNETGATRLSLAGGVAHNCAANGLVLKRGLFDEVFVQPASHDAGLSLGAALHGYRSAAPTSSKPTVMTHASLGSPCGDDAEIEQELARWRACVEYHKAGRLAVEVAEMMAEGLIVGWVQGRSEFGPRALGNRSIVADPRPAENKDIINAMIKKREAFRPFAPSVLEEYADQYFELPSHQKRFPFMVFVVNVREPYRKLLGAITHVDGTARIQTVSRSTNPAYWALIDAFGRRTGIPIVLNTSFNNNAEPIVNSARDALVCYLTTDLHVLVIGDYVIRKRSIDKEVYKDFHLELPGFLRVQCGQVHGNGNGAPRPAADVPFYRQLFDDLYVRDPDADYFLGNTHDASQTHDARKPAISAALAARLAQADGYRSFRALTADLEPSAQDALLDEVLTLWGKRLIRVLPGPGIQ